MEEVSIKDIVESNFREHGATLARIEAQTVKTNGRVSSLERWRAMLVGAWVVVVAILLPIVAIVVDVAFKK